MEKSFDIKKEVQFSFFGGKARNKDDIEGLPSSVFVLRPNF